MSVDQLGKPDQERLVQAARAARRNAYAPYSRFKVGAALLLTDGTIVAGCNVENASFSATICAERVAAGTAIANGRRDWIAIAIASDGGVSPCGICRQFLAEFRPQLLVLMADAEHDSLRTVSLSKLLPEQFDRSSVGSLPARQPDS